MTSLQNNHNHNHTTTETTSENCYIEIPSWRLQLQDLIISRDEQETEPFNDISLSYDQILEENLVLTSRVNELNQALLKLKSESWKRSNTQIENDNDDTVQDNNNNVNVTEYKKKIESLKKELMDVYRLKREDEEALRRLKKQSIEYEELLIKRRDMLDEMSSNYQRLNEEFNDMKNDFEKCNGALITMNKENKELRVAHDNALKDLESVRSENISLAGKILRLQEERMDEQNKLHEEFQKLQESSRRQLQIEMDRLKIQSDTRIRSNTTMLKKTNSKEKYSPRLRSNTEISPKRKSPKLNTKPSLGDSISRFFSGLGFDSNHNDKIDQLQSKDNSNNTSDSSKDIPSIVLTSNEPIVNLFDTGGIFNIDPPQLKQHNWIAHGDGVMCLAYDNRGKNLLSVSKDKVVKLWRTSTTTNNELCKFYGSEGGVMTCQFSTNNNYVAAGGNDCCVILWEVKTQKIIKKYNGHYNTITTVKFTANNSKIISGSHDRNIKIWDTEKAACLYNLSAKSSVNAIDLSPDQFWMSSAHLDGNIRFWSFKQRKEVFELNEHKPITTNGVQFSPPDGVHVLTTDKNGRIIIWDLRKRAKLYEILPNTSSQSSNYYKNSNPNGGATYSPDGRYIIAGTQKKNKKNGKYSLFIWNSKNCKLSHTLDEHLSPINYVTWHNRGGVASCDQSGSIITWT